MNEKGNHSTRRLACLLLTSIQTMVADGTVPAPEIYGPFLAGARAPPQFYLDFIDMRSASMALTDAGTSSAKYTFTMTMLSTPSGWMKPDWEPRFAPPHVCGRVGSYSTGRRLELL